ncbi:unnamed protein product [Echinostoma caproni]|uniref:Uncharacterized protein n=1 Tax=Echinostoma caproni TaxID=27848 RepID=A0A183B9E1_9TREM|nr:unnamed protein product [Echinostoma caproni]
MPSGYLYRIPVCIIRPLALTLSVYTFQKTDTVIFAIRVACMDLHDSTFQITSPMEQPNLEPSTPLTFRLTKCQLLLTAPNVPDSVLAKSNANSNSTVGGKSSESISVPEPLPIGSEDAPVALTNGTSTARPSELKKPRNSMVGIPINPSNSEIVSHPTR